MARRTTSNTRATFLDRGESTSVASVRPTRAECAAESINPPINPREGRQRALQLLDQLKDVGPASGQLAIDHARDVAGFDTLLHRAMPAVQERHADNMATLLAGYWVSDQSARDHAAGADEFVAESPTTIIEQQEIAEENDA